MERAHAHEFTDASVIRGGKLSERAEAHGRYEIECIGADGKLKWRDTIDNVVATVGKNLALDTFLAGSAYTVTGPFMGLISSVSWSAVSASDTMASHAGWLEAGGTNAPTYTGNRPTIAWSAATAGTIATSAALSYAITGSGTVKGAFVVFGSGAVTTKDNTAGTLWSAGVFAAGDKVVVASDTLNIKLFIVAVRSDRRWVLVFVYIAVVMAVILLTFNRVPAP